MRRLGTFSPLAIPSATFSCPSMSTLSTARPSSRTPAPWGLERIVAKRRERAYRSGPSKHWIKIKNPSAPAATRVIEG
jgi:ATP-dependent DNA ligase